MEQTHKKQYKPVGDWESCFEWLVDYTPHGLAHKLDIQTLIAKDLITNKYQTNEFYVDANDTSIAIVFLYETPNVPPYTKTTDKIMHENLDKFIENDWLSYSGLTTSRYNHPILVKVKPLN